ncbi:MAG TPA: hypothetical protein VF818_12520 [Ktedonobacterales bacterium]
MAANTVPTKAETRVAEYVTEPLSPIEARKTEDEALHHAGQVGGAVMPSRWLRVEVETKRISDSMSAEAQARRAAEHTPGE